MKNEPTIESLIAELAKTSDVRIMSPKTVNDLRESGVPFQTSTPTAEETVERLFSSERRSLALGLAHKLPMSSGLPTPSINELYYEIQSAMLLGLNGAAITLCAILVEHALRYACYKREMGGFVKYDAEKMDRFEQLSLKKLIQLGKKKGLLTGEEVAALEVFHDQIRNPYNHYNLKKIAGDFEGPVTVLNVKTKTQEVKQMRAKDSLVLQAAIKPEIDARNVLRVFAFVDGFVKTLWAKLNDG